HQLHRRHGEGAPDRVRPAPGRGGHGSRGERVDDVPEGDIAAARSRDPGRGAPRLRTLDRRLRDHVLQRGAGADVPDLRLDAVEERDTASGERRRERDLPHCDCTRPRERLLAVPSCQVHQTRDMTTTSPGLSPAELQKAARDHLWLHFTRMSDGEVPVIVRGEGCYLEDANGKRYLDGLAGLFAVQIGYSYGDEIGQAAHDQMRELPFYTNWSYAHP